MARIKTTWSAFRIARGFGRGVIVSGLLAARMLVCGRTGKYKIF